MARHDGPIDRDDLIRYLRGVRIVEDPIDGRALIDATPEIDAYVWLHARSAKLSLEMLRRHLPTGRRLRVLELGGAPYFFSTLMHRHFDVELTAANVQAAAWPGEAATLERGLVRLEVPDAGDGERRMALENRPRHERRDRPRPLRHRCPRRRLSQRPRRGIRARPELLRPRPRRHLRRMAVPPGGQRSASMAISSWDWRSQALAASMAGMSRFRLSLMPCRAAP